MGSSRTRDGNCVPCIGRQILIHCTTQEVQKANILLCPGIAEGWESCLGSLNKALIPFLGIPPSWLHHLPKATPPSTITLGAVFLTYAFFRGWGAGGREVTQTSVYSPLPLIKVKLLISVQLFATPWTIAYQVPLSMGFSRQEHWSGLPFPSPLPLIKPLINSITLDK